MGDLKVGEHDLLSWVQPDTLFGAIVYLVVFAAIAALLSRGVRSAVHAAMTRQGHIDRTTVSFLQQITTAMIWIIMLILYAHLIPVLRSMGTALLAGASVASVVIGLAAQSTLGNLVAGVSITIYKPFRPGRYASDRRANRDRYRHRRVHIVGIHDIEGARRAPDCRPKQHRREPGNDQPEHHLRALAHHDHDPPGPRRSAGRCAETCVGRCR